MTVTERTTNREFNKYKSWAIFPEREYIKQGIGFFILFEEVASWATSLNIIGIDIIGYSAPKKVHHLLQPHALHTCNLERIINSLEFAEVKSAIVSDFHNVFDFINIIALVSEYWLSKSNRCYFLVFIDVVQIIHVSSEWAI